ncbi:hypothetical protein HGH93_20390 [Chitinophaga polysaccharea]|uniref:hypothetical protein n=1 Tax=Chitinophaga polysaccharea TaxID=1293035 RepID=UPI001454F2C1|nr:hypothetical protein [Chitinophaga polysaccharea]NLR60481.1 hypothetical protein [Chitinophaga polysaccharea]
MDYIFDVYWGGNLVGEITNLSQDMWYMSGDWCRFETAETARFEQLLHNFDMKRFQQDPVGNSVKVILSETAQPDKKIFCLVFYLKEKEIELRQIVAEEALNLFFPDR